MDIERNPTEPLGHGLVPDQLDRWVARLHAMGHPPASQLRAYLRDIQQVLGLLLAALFYTAPILYPLTLVPEKFQGLVWLNPFTAFAESFHGAVLAGSWPEPSLLLGLALLAVGSLAVGAYVFRRLEPGFADVL